MMIERLDPDHPYVKRADAMILDVINTPGKEALVELYAGLLWEAGMQYADQDDDASQRCAYICFLMAIDRTPGAPPDAGELCAAFFDDDFLAIMEKRMAQQETEPATLDEDTDPALDARVRPLLAWLDA